MKKFVGIFNVESYYKEGVDRKGIVNANEEMVTTILKPNGWVRGDGRGTLTLHTTDSQSPDWADTFIVTIEKLENLPENRGSELTDFLEAKIQEKLTEGVKPIVGGRKFR